MPNSQFNQIMAAIGALKHSVSELFSEVQAVRNDFQHLRCQVAKVPESCDSDPTELIEVEPHG